MLELGLISKNSREVSKWFRRAYDAEADECLDAIIGYYEAVSDTKKIQEWKKIRDAEVEPS
jgi:hypothetical protein